MPGQDEQKQLDLVEVRIHGVSGTPKTAMLEYGDTILVAGDEVSGFHRRRGWHAYGPAEAGGRVGPVRRHLEAYSWGGLTSGRASRAAWLPLLPFALVNVASWAIPPATGEPSDDPEQPSPSAPWRGPVRQSLLATIRLLALTMTVGFIVALAGVGMDQVGWQCGGSEECSTGRRNWLRWWMPWLGQRSPGVRIAVGALIPLLTLGLLWRLSRRSYDQYEKTKTIGLDASEGPYVDGLQTPFALVGFWQRKQSVARLRALHIAAPVAVVSALLAYPGVRNEAGAIPDVIAFALAMALLVVCVVCVLTPRISDLGRELDKHVNPGGFKEHSPLARRLAFASYATLLIAIAAAIHRADHVARRVVLPGYGATLWVIAIVQFGALATLAVLTYLARPSAKQDPTPFLAGWAAPVFATVGLVVGTLMTNGVLYKSADLLATVPGQSTAHTVPFVFRVHALYQWTAWLAGSGAVITLLALAVFLAYVVVRLVLGHELTPWREKQYPILRDGVRSDYALPEGEDGRVDEVARARYDATLVDRAPIPLLVVAVAGVVIGVTTIVLSFVIGRPSDHFLKSDSYGVRILDAIGVHSFAPSQLDVVSFGTLVIGLSVVGLVGIGVRAYRNDTLRRTVGIVWDVATFWPRSAHPLAPPCYCERTVPQLTTRVTGLVSQGQPVLVSAHSQGTIIAAAALFQVDAPTIAHVALLTHGSPLRRLYARAFPAYFCAGTFEMLRDRLTDGSAVRWRNCWRKTDYLGKWIFKEPSPGDARYLAPDTVDVLVEDPPAHPLPHDLAPHPALHPSGGDVDAPKPLRHSDYYRSHEYDACVLNLDAMLTATTVPAVSLVGYYPLADGAKPPTLADVDAKPPW
jgi:hypothetical protein